MKHLAEINPVARGISFILAVAGTLASKSLTLMLIFWGVGVLPLLALSGLLPKYWQFCRQVVLPIMAGLLLVWSLLVGAPPASRPHSDPVAGMFFAFFVSMRLFLLAAVSQLLFFTIGPDQLVATLSAWRLRGEYLVATVGSLTLLPEMKLRAQQVYTARCARGLLQSTALSQRVKQVPYIFRTLLVWAIRSAVQRSEMWAHRNLLPRLAAQARRQITWTVLDALCLTIALFWFLLCIGSRLQRNL